MKGRIGCQTRIITVIPHSRELARKQNKDLSEKAKLRLKVFDWYYQKSPTLSITRVRNASLTCRHFGIHRSLFYYWLQRYNKQYLHSLENKSRAPKRKRQPDYSQELVSKVRDIRKADPTYSAKKIRRILLRSMAEVPSVATLGRLIRRNNLFFRPDTKQDLFDNSISCRTSPVKYCVFCCFIRKLFRN